tara:strand:+ start:182 stop:622 length:441 start_codon:yes stop_codon:yes gene_type:complete
MSKSNLLNILETLFETSREDFEKVEQFTDTLMNKVSLAVSLSVVLRVLSEELETDSVIEQIARGQLVKFIRELDADAVQSLTEIHRGVFAPKVSDMMETYRMIFGLEEGTEDTETFDVALGALSKWEDDMESAVLLQSDCINEYPV